MIMNDSQNYGDQEDGDFELDDFTKKRLPKAEDFKSPVIVDESQKQKKKQKKESNSSLLINDY